MTVTSSTGPSTSPVHFDRDEDDSESSDTQPESIIPNEKHNLALLLCLLPPLFLYQEHLALTSVPARKKPTIKEEATAMWNNALMDRPWALKAFWDLSCNVHRFISGYQPDFLQFQTDNPPQLIELQRVVQFLSIEYRRWNLQWKHCQRTIIN